jgi:FkbM family methyltransferase
MSRLKSLFTHSLIHYAWQEFAVRYRFKYVLPHITETTLDGIRLDLSKLSLKVRNRILMGIYEAHEKQMCLEYLNAQDAVLEIGGAIGFVGLVCQKKIGIQQYYTFEANPNTIDILRSNYRLNGLEPAVWNVALGPDHGYLELDVESDFWDNSIVAPSGRKPGRTVKVPGAPLASLLRQIPGPVNVLIIDVEGAEQFLRLDEVPEEVDKLIIELHPQVLGAEKSYDLVAGLIQRGFRVAREENATFALLKRARPVAAVPHLSRTGAPERRDPLAVGAEVKATF